MIHPAHRRRHGQTALEFALSLSALFLFVLAIFETVMMGYTWDVMAGAAKAGVRYAVVHGADVATADQSGPTCPCPLIAGSSGVVASYAETSLHNVSGMTVTVTYPDSSNAPPSRVRIAVSYPFQPFFVMGYASLTITAAAEGRIVF